MSFLQKITLVFVLSALSCLNVFGGKNKPVPCPYRAAINEGDLKGFQALVDQDGLDLKGSRCPCVESCDGHLPLLQLAALRGREDIVRMLLDAGVSVSGAYFACGKHALVDAVGGGDVRIVELLLDAWEGGSLGWSEAFFYAIEQRNEAMVTLFIRRGINVNEGMQTRQHPLHIAAREGDADIVQQLLDAGAEVDLLDMDLHIPLHGAAGAGHVEVVEILLAVGANPTWKCWTEYDEEYTPLDVALYRLNQWQERTPDEIVNYRRWQSTVGGSAHTPEENEALRQEKIRRLQRIIQILEAAERAWPERQREMREVEYEEAYAGVPELFEVAVDVGGGVGGAVNLEGVGVRVGLEVQVVGCGV